MNTSVIRPCAARRRPSFATPSLHRAAALVLALAALAASASEPIAANGPPLLVFTNAAGATIPYRQFVPADLRDGERVPLVLLLHGAGERGTENRRQLVHGGRQILAWGRQRKTPFILVAPQCPSVKQWVDVPWGARAHTMPERPSETLALATELLADRLAALPADPDRVYATGVSMGGYGVWDLLQRRPGFFAAAVPVCGGGDTNLASRLVSVPIRAFHGKADGIVPPFRSRSMVDAIRAAGGSLAELNGGSCKTFAGGVNRRRHRRLLRRVRAARVVLRRAKGAAAGVCGRFRMRSGHAAAPASRSQCGSMRLRFG